MEPRAQHVLIGFFTLFTVLAILGFALWLGKAGGNSEQVPYDILVRENVSGLTPGSPVLHTGIKVGEVTALTLDHNDPSKVWIRVAIARDTPIHQSTTARISIANITGAAVIHLENDDPASPRLKSKGDEVAVIKAKPSPFTQLKSSGEELLLNITKLVNSANDFFSQDNSRALARTLTHLETVTGAVAGEKDAIGQGVKDLAGATAEFRATLNETTTLLRQFNGQFAAHGPAMFERADASLKSIEELSANLNGLMTDNRGALSDGVQGLAEIGPAVTELSEVLANLREITRRLEENPSGYLLSGEKIQEYQP